MPGALQVNQNRILYLKLVKEFEIENQIGFQVENSYFWRFLNISKTTAQNRSFGDEFYNNDQIKYKYFQKNSRALFSWIIWLRWSFSSLHAHWYIYRCICPLLSCRIRISKPQWKSLQLHSFNNRIYLYFIFIYWIPSKIFKKVYNRVQSLRLR